MCIVQLLFTLSLLVRSVAGTCSCGDVCKEYVRDGGKCWIVFDFLDKLAGAQRPNDLKKCEDWLKVWTKNCDGKCNDGDVGYCSPEFSKFFDNTFTWCPGACQCNIVGCACTPFNGCTQPSSLIEAVDIPDSKDDHDWYTGLSNQDKLAHLNKVICEKHGYGDATSLELVKDIDDRVDKNYIDEHEKTYNGAKDDGTISHEEFIRANSPVDDLAEKHCTPIGGKPGKSGKNAKNGKKAKRA